jgi:hypothetical protein
MSKLAPILNFLGKTFHPFKVGKLDITPTYWQALVIVILLFFLVFTLARMRYLYVNWHLGRHSFAMFFWGFLLALIVEGFFIIGGRTLFTEILGMKNVPKPISTILDIGRNRLITVLGVSDQVPSSSASQDIKSGDVYQLYNSLSPDEAEKLYSEICKPKKQ